MLSEQARQIFRKHAYIIDPGQLDSEGFVIDSGRSDEELEWLVKAAAVAKDASIPVNVETCGPYLEEVVRQRAAFGQ